MKISHVINNIKCICSLVAHAFNLKCFMIDLNLLTWPSSSGLRLGTWDDKSLETCGNLLTNANLWNSFVKLQVLQFRGCSFMDQLPKEIFSITTLLEVDLQYCQEITAIPEELGNLSSLTTLKLRGCVSLTTLPEGFGNLSSLTTLDLKDWEA